MSEFLARDPLPGVLESADLLLVCRGAQTYRATGSQAGQALDPRGPAYLSWAEQASTDSVADDPSVVVGAAATSGEVRVPLAAEGFAVDGAGLRPNINNAGDIAFQAAPAGAPLLLSPLGGLRFRHTGGSGTAQIWLKDAADPTQKFLLAAMSLAASVQNTDVRIPLSGQAALLRDARYGLFLTWQKAEGDPAATITVLGSAATDTDGLALFRVVGVADWAQPNSATLRADANFVPSGGVKHQLLEASDSAGGRRWIENRAIQYLEAFPDDFASGHVVMTGDKMFVGDTANGAQAIEMTRGEDATPSSNDSGYRRDQYGSLDRASDWLNAVYWDDDSQTCIVQIVSWTDPGDISLRAGNAGTYRMNNGAEGAAHVWTYSAAMALDVFAQADARALTLTPTNAISFWRELTLGGQAGGGLNQSEVDARVREGVHDWAEASSSATIPPAFLPASASRVFGQSLLEDSSHGLALVTTGSDRRGAAIVLSGAPDLDTVTHGIVEVEASFSVSGAVGGLQVAGARDDAIVHVSEVRTQPTYNATRSINGVRASTVEVRNAASVKVGDFSVCLGRDDSTNELLAFVAFEADGGSSGVRGTITARISIQFVPTDVNALLAAGLRRLDALPDSLEEATVGEVVVVGETLHQLRQVGSATVATEFSFTVTNADSPDQADEDRGYQAARSGVTGYGEISGEYPGLTEFFGWEDTDQAFLWRFHSLTDPGSFAQFRVNNINLDASWDEDETDAWNMGGTNRYSYGAPQNQVGASGATLRVRGQLGAGKYLTWWAPFSVAGARGPVGPKGDQGDRGPPGQGAGTSTFIAQTDTPDAFSQAGDFPKINSTNNALVFAELMAADIKSGRLDAARLPVKLDELMGSFALVGWINEPADGALVGPGNASAYSASDIARLAYVQSHDQSPAQVGWYIPIRVPNDRVAEVAAGELRLQLDDGLFVQSDVGGPGAWTLVGSVGNYTYYQTLAANVPVGLQRMQHNQKLALTEEAVKAVARTVIPSDFSPPGGEVLAATDVYFTNDPSRPAQAGNPININRAAWKWTPWRDLWTHTEQAACVLLVDISLRGVVQWTAAQDDDRVWFEVRGVRVRNSIEREAWRDEAYIRHLTGDTESDGTKVGKCHAEEIVPFAAGDQHKVQVRVRSQRGPAVGSSTSGAPDSATATRTVANNRLRFPANGDATNPNRIHIFRLRG